MATLITKNRQTSGTLPLPTELVRGELAINTEDRHLFTKDASDLIIRLNPDDTGGTLWNTSPTYNIGDMVTTTPGGHIYHAVTSNTSIDPSTDNGTNWTQPATPGPTVYTYNFNHTDLLGTVPSAVPSGPHDHEFDGGTPDENGPYYFSVELGNNGKACEVYIDGFQLNPGEFDSNTNDGYILTVSEVPNNSWVKVVI